VTLDNIP